ncbi:MAG: sulfurtransferase [Candidatus Limnocylindria bacterium]
MTSYANPDSLVETDWLQRRLDDPAVAIVEVDEDTSAYDTSHIPGAVSINWRTELHDQPRREFISTEQLADLLGAKGISDEQTIVLYGGNNNWFAAYGFWLCRLRGTGDVRLLNGGRKKWELEDRPMTADRPPVAPRSYTMRDQNLELRALRDEVMADVQDGRRIRFVDVRSPEEYRGEKLAPPHLPQEQAQVPGHIPGAINVPWSSAANDDGTFKSAEELRTLYTGQGVGADDEIVAYCRIGERSSHTWFVLKELLGFAKVRNYDGSWTEYGSLVGAPVERSEVTIS